SVSGKAPGCVATDGSLPAYPTPNLAAALGGGLPAGWKWRRSAEVSGAVHLPGCALEQPHRRRALRPCDVSLSRWRHQADADLYTVGAGLHWAVSTAHLTPRLRESPLLRAVPPGQSPYAGTGTRGVGAAGAGRNVACERIVPGEGASTASRA